MSILIVLITHHAPLQLKLQVRAMPPGAAYMALQFDQSGSYIQHATSPQLSHVIVSSDDPVTFAVNLNTIKIANAFEHIVLCCDANLGTIGGEELSAQLKELIAYLKPSQALLYAQTILALRDAYYTFVSDKCVGFEYILCTQESFRSRMSELFLKLSQGQFITEFPLDLVDNASKTSVATSALSGNEIHTPSAKPENKPKLASKKSSFLSFWSCIRCCDTTTVYIDSDASASLGTVPVSNHRPL